MRLLFKRYPQLLLAFLFFLGSFFIYLYVGLPSDAKGKEAMVEEGRREWLGTAEACFNCHAGVQGFAPAHNPEIIGCSSCHLGNNQAEKKKKAHEGMIAVPGNMDDVMQTCGNPSCHRDIAVRVEKSLMNTMAGVVSVNHFAFEESDSLDRLMHIQQISQLSPADNHLRHLCASCHLGNQKEHAAPISELSRGGGCNACHINYKQESKAALQKYHDQGDLPLFHPASSIEVKNEHCFGCHSRSGRISTNYEGWHETQLLWEEVADTSNYRLLEDGRVFEKIAADVHHERGLECVDCHHATEIMGDGMTYFHEDDAIKIQCEDCHFSSKPETVGFDQLDFESKKILALRGFKFHEKKFVVGPQSDLPLYNVLVNEEGAPYLVGKNSGESHPLLPPADICTQGSGHDQVTCTACHTGWAPQCVGCHTTYNASAKGYDLLDHRPTKGKWEEYLGVFLPEPPSLGVVEAMNVDSEMVKKIKAFIPGMIMTIDTASFTRGEATEEEYVFQRLFAPTVPHTVTTKGRNCKSCHNNPVALGYGRGDLEYRIENGRGVWAFEPDYVNSAYDGLPEDAWIGFLESKSFDGISNLAPEGAATRGGARAFSIAEQRRILTVGACLTCHADNDRSMLEGLEGFDSVLKKVSSECVLPEF